MLFPGEIYNANVTFEPLESIDYDDYIIITHNMGGANETVQVIGSGVNLPDVINSVINEITTTTATGGGEVLDDGNADVTAFGVCWNTATMPVITNAHTVDGSGLGTFVSYLTNLVPDAHYYVRAYATNCVGTTYSTEEEFDTLPSVPPNSPENLTIIISSGDVVLNWDAVSGADSYKIYSSDDPEMAFENWTLEQENITGITWSETIPTTKKFYCVTAVIETDNFERNKSNK